MRALLLTRRYALMMAAGGAVGNFAMLYVIWIVVARSIIDQVKEAGRRTSGVEACLTKTRPEISYGGRLQRLF